MINGISAGLSSVGTVVKSRAFQWFVVVAVILIFAYILYRQGVKSGGFQAAKKLPNNGNGIPAGWTPTALSDELWKRLKTYDWYEYFGGVNASSDDARIPVMARLMDLTNDQITAVYNDYNARYGNKDGKTSLTAKIADENFLPSKDVVVIRLNSLGLT
jgi:hypothetical protein